MKQWFIAGFMMVLLLAAPAVMASSDQNSALAKDQTVNKDYFAAGGTVEIAGTVNGDAYVAGGQVNVSGTINGDLIATGGNVLVSGTVNGNVRTAGGQVTLDGKVTKNVTAAGGNVVVNGPATIEGNMVVGGGSVLISGPVKGHLKAGTGNLIISSQIGGDVEAGVGQLHLNSGAQIGGHLTYVSQNDAKIDSGSNVTGGITKKAPPVRQAPSGSGRLLGLLFSILSTLLMGAVMVKLFPGAMLAMTSTVRRRTWSALGLGFALLILVPIALVFLAITVVGIPLALILAGLYIISLYLSHIVTIFAVGTLLYERLDKRTSLWSALVLGVLIYAIFGLIPIAGGIIYFVSLLIGLGAAALTFTHYRHPAKT